MGFLGILFEREYDIPLLIFTQKKEISSNQIIGFNQTMANKYKTIFLNQQGTTQKVIILDESSFIYSKISLSQITNIDYMYRTFWFNPKSYKILRDLLYIRNANKGDYSLRFTEVISYF